MKKFVVFPSLAAVTVFAGLLASAVIAATTTGTWVQYPTGAPEHQAVVQPPINADGSSNWPAKSKGTVPIMFKLSSRIGPAAFESIGSDADADNDFAFMSFTPDPGITFNQITTLKTDYSFTTGNCHGGSLRWSVRTSPTQSVFIYYGDLPNFTNCTTNNQSGVNMVGLGDLRYDTSQYLGGTFYDTYAHTQTLVGTTPIIRASLVIDSGWAGDQRLNVTNTTVNDNVYQFVSSAGTFAPTCDLPPATIRVTKTGGEETGPVNETATTYSPDSGENFRVVDCKYQYNLSIPSLKGAGAYTVEILIGGTPVGAASFELK